MEVGDWITLGAVLVALGIGVTSILHTRSMQKRERRERLLNEIIEWAEGVAEILQSWNIAYVARMTGDLDKIYSYHTDWLENLNRLKVRSLYVSKIANAKIFGKHLKKCVDQAVNKLDEHIKLFYVFLDDKVNQEEIVTHKSLFYLSIKEVLEEATKIKTGDMG